MSVDATMPTAGVATPSSTSSTSKRTTASPGQTAYSGTYNLNPGNTSFVWDGKGNDGSQWPAGAYKLTTTAKDTSGNPVPITTETQGVVDSVDLTATPALLSIAGQTYT